MMSGRDVVSRAAPLLACIGLLGLWEIAALVLSTDSFPTAWVAIRAIPSILGDKDFLIIILDPLRPMLFPYATLFRSCGSPRPHRTPSVVLQRRASRS